MGGIIDFCWGREGVGGIKIWWRGSLPGWIFLGGDGGGGGEEIFGWWGGG